MIFNGCKYCEASGWLCDECDVERPICEVMAEAAYSATVSIKQLTETLVNMQVRAAK